MKKLISYCLALTLTFAIYNTADAQVRKVPAEVTEAFRQKYPTALNVEWRDRLSGFTASFDQNNIHYEAKFTNKGFWQSTENKVPDADILPAVKEGFQKSKYAEEWSIKQAYKIDLREAKTQYRLDIQKNDILKKQLFFDSTGRMLRDNITL
ncbi:MULTISPECIES: PepSY-like domain-containing protein [Niastella]|uniref:PepSY-like domain-containing protein n=1 Tax=Niastella soli TaxID=2821487 RepID=A0ABS3YM16_9BACT|nr:PepSY-like domain-containing protein [Niastella soli]MBO9198920.1 PepSY-like domain-containing protein [Niastella soli]